MNYYVSILFRAIPLVMAAICVSFGLLIISAGDTVTDFIAGHVTLFLAAICLCLFSTASVIILQLIGKFRMRHRWLYPAFAYCIAILTLGSGIYILNEQALPDYFVAGHVVAGLGLICFCISTVALASIKFNLIPQNSRGSFETSKKPLKAFSKSSERVLLAIPVIVSLIGWIWSFTLIVRDATPDHFIAGHVMAGLSAICTSLIALLWAVVRQIQNIFGYKERFFWPSIVVLMAITCLIWGAVLIFFKANSPIWYPPGFVLIGLGLICFSILSKVLLLSLVWKRVSLLANRVPLLTVMTALTCLFISAFLFEISPNKVFALIPARVLIGLGAICFSLFSIVSILESGTARTKST